MSNIANNVERIEIERLSKGSSISYALSVLRLLAEREQPLGVNAIARELSIAPSTCFRILKILVAENFVEVDSSTKGYSIGIDAVTIALSALDPARALAAIRPMLEDTAQAHSIAIGLWRMLPHDRMILIGFVEGTKAIRIHMSVGQRIPALVGAVGRAVAADLNMSKQELKENFRSLRWQSPLTFDEYYEQVEQAKKKGFGFDPGNFSLGVNTVAVTIRDETGAVRYGLSGIMFNGLHSPEAIDRIASDLILVAKRARVRLVNGSFR